jgi:hypothetical protein
LLSLSPDCMRVGRRVHADCPLTAHVVSVLRLCACLEKGGGKGGAQDRLVWRSPAEVVIHFARQAGVCSVRVGMCGQLKGGMRVC